MFQHGSFSLCGAKAVLGFHFTWEKCDCCGKNDITGDCEMITIAINHTWDDDIDIILHACTVSCLKNIMAKTSQKEFKKGDDVLIKYANISFSGSFILLNKYFQLPHNPKKS